MVKDNKENFSEKRKQELKLVQAAQRGDEEAFTKLFEMYYRVVYYVVYKMVKNHDDAEDLTIESFTKAFENINYYIPSNAFITWLSKIAVNRTIDFLRKQKNSQNTVSIDQSHPQAEDDNARLSNLLETDITDPEAKVISNEKSELLVSFIEQLPPDYSRIMKMRHLEQLSYKEIAKKLELPLGTVKARLHRGKELLASLIRNKRDIFR